MELAAKRIAHTKWTNAGQICISSDHILVHGKVYDEFKRILIEVTTKFWGEDVSKNPHYSKIAHTAHSERTWKLLEGVEDKIVCQLGKPDHKNRVFPPVIVDQPALDSKVMTDECFGPILPLRKFTRHDELVDEINSRGRPLVIYYYGDQDSALKDTLIKRTRSGTFAMNDCMLPLLNPNLPFGGSGDSGYGCLHTELCHKGMSVNRCVIESSPELSLADADERYPGIDTDSDQVISYLARTPKAEEKLRTFAAQNKIMIAFALVMIFMWFLGVFKVTFPHGTWLFNMLGIF